MGGHRDLVVRPREFYRDRASSRSLVGPWLVAVVLAVAVVSRVFAVVAVLGDLLGELEGEYSHLVFAVGDVTVAAPRELTVAVTAFALWSSLSGSSSQA
jgi:hypothetical protein